MSDNAELISHIVNQRSSMQTVEVLHTTQIKTHADAVSRCVHTHNSDSPLRRLYRNSLGYYRTRVDIAGSPEASPILSSKEASGEMLRNPGCEPSKKEGLTASATKQLAYGAGSKPVPTLHTATCTP